MTQSGENQTAWRKPVPLSPFSITNPTQSGLRLNVGRRLTALNQQICRSVWSSFTNTMPNSRDVGRTWNGCLHTLNSNIKKGPLCPIHRMKRRHFTKYYLQYEKNFKQVSSVVQWTLYVISSVVQWTLYVISSVVQWTLYVIFPRSVKGAFPY